MRAIPSLYFTNLISSRPLMGPAGAGSLAQVINVALSGKARFDAMRGFFEGVGSGDSAGVWDGLPRPQPQYREFHRRQLDKLARRRKAEEMI
jgi:chlorophyllide a reductase subunit Y